MSDQYDDGYDRQLQIARWWGRLVRDRRMKILAKCKLKAWMVQLEFGDFSPEEKLKIAEYYDANVTPPPKPKKIQNPGVFKRRRWWRKD